MNKNKYYSDDCDDNWAGILRDGERGQALLEELLAALDAMPEKRVIPYKFEDEAGEHCALGVLAKARIIAKKLDPEDPEAVAEIFNCAPALAREIMWENDKIDCDPETRWKHVRRWVATRLAKR